MVLEAGSDPGENMVWGQGSTKADKIGKIGIIRFLKERRIK